MKNLFATLYLLGAGVTWTEVSNAMEDFFKSMFQPIVIVLAVVVVLWGIFVGVKYWMAAGDENKRKEANKALVNLIIGTVVIFLVAVAMPLIIRALAQWQSNFETEIEFSRLVTDFRLM